MDAPGRRLVSFDANGTLLAPYPSVGEIYARACQPFGLRAEPDRLQAAFDAAWSRRQARGETGFLATRGDAAATRAWWRGFVHEILEAIAFEGDRDGCLGACMAAFAHPGSWMVFADVRPALEALARRGMTLGVLSNWDLRLEAILAALGLRPYFSFVLVSALEGLAKPDPAFFRRACERAGVPTSAAVHVGDRADLDLLPARACGMRAYLIDRRSAAGSPGVLRSLADLPAVLD